MPLPPGIDLTDPDTVDVGQDHIIRIMYTDDTETEIAALVLMHPHAKDPDTLCQGYAEIGPGEWEIVVKDPLTIHPSFVCNDCGDHGIVRGGKWQEAVFETGPKHEMPVWLRYAMMSFCDSHQEIDHVYRRPIPEYDYASPMDFVLYNRWSELAFWLDKQCRAHNAHSH